MNTPTRPALRLLDGPLNAPAPAPVPLPDGRALHPSSGLRRRPVLYVGGEPEARMAFTRMAASWVGVKLLVAESGRAGLQLAADRRPRLVVLEARLPDLDAHQVLRALRRHLLARTAPVVVLAHSACARERARFVWAGAGAYVARPHDALAVSRAVGALLEAASWR